MDEWKDKLFSTSETIEKCDMYLFLPENVNNPIFLYFNIPKCHFFAYNRKEHDHHQRSW
jgi:hypothetical protein